MTKVPEPFSWPRYEDGMLVIPGRDGVGEIELFSEGFRVWPETGRGSEIIRYGEPVSRGSITDMEDNE